MSKPLSAAQNLVVEQMQLGWMLHFNGTIKPPYREDQSEKMYVVNRRIIITLKDRGLIEFSHRSDYWTMTK